MSKMYMLYTLTSLLCQCLAYLPCLDPPCSDVSTEAQDLANSLVNYPPYFAKGVTYKDLKAWYQQPPSHLLVSDSPINFGTLPLKTRVFRYIKVSNPTDDPIITQLFLLLDSGSVKDVLRNGCTQQRFTQEPLLDEDEFDSNSEDFMGNCKLDYEEVKAIMEASAQSSKPFPKYTTSLTLLDKMRQFAIYSENRAAQKEKQSARLNLLPKYKCHKECSWVLSDPDCNASLLQSSSQSFYLSPKARAIQMISPHSSAILGPVVFQANALGHYAATILLRNNATGFESEQLIAEVKYARLAFKKESTYRPIRNTHRVTTFTQSQEMQSLTFEITEEDIDSQTIDNFGTKRLPASLRLTRIYEAQNVGTIPMLVTNILINGDVCSLMGITVVNCEESYLVQPKESIQIIISYEVTFTQRELQVQLWIVTEDDSFFLPLEVSLKLENLERLSDTQGVNRDSWEYFLCENSMLLNVCIALGCICTIGFEVLMKKNPSLRLRRFTFARPLKTSFASINLDANLKAPTLRRASSPVSTEPQRSLTPPPHVLIEEKPKLEEVQKQKKFKKRKSAILKFDPIPVSKIDAHPSNLIIATNKLLIAKKKVKPVETSLEEEGEKFDGKESRDFDSFTTTHTEDGDVDDEYLDEYKTRTGLFSGFSTRTS